MHFYVQNPTLCKIHRSVNLNFHISVRGFSQSMSAKYGRVQTPSHWSANVSISTTPLPPLSANFDIWPFSLLPCQPYQEMLYPLYLIDKKRIVDQKGNCAFADLRYVEKDSISPSILIFGATEC